MRSYVRPGGVTLLFAFAAALVVADGSAAAEPDDDRGGDSDIAVPISPAELAAQEASVPPPPDVGIPAATSAIDDFLYSDLMREGTAAEVCHGGIRRGAMWTFRVLTARFGGSAGSMYVCRERWNAAEEPDCNGSIVDPVRQPDFYSTCWSNHAQGRAIDIMVGTDGDGYNSTRGRAIIRWLLAPDEAGNQNANARRLGVQQLLFEDRCWDSDGDRGIASWTQMRECGIGHFDHIHIDLTLPGATGNVSWWGARPRVAPKINSVLSWNRNNGVGRLRTFTNLRATAPRLSSWSKRWHDVVVGDWDGDRRVDDVLLWNGDTGEWAVRSYWRSRSRWRAGGRFTGGYDQLVAGDFNADGRRNELFLRRSASGAWQVQTWSGFSIRRRVKGHFRATHDELMAGDFDGNGVFNDLLLWNPSSGRWMVKRFRWLTPHHPSEGRWALGWDRVHVADLDSDGELDESLLWNRSTGRWVILDWVGHRPRTVRRGAFSPAADDVVVADLDTDGRLDDAIVRDQQTGRFSIHKWHALQRRFIRTGRWSPGAERVVAGTWH
jgi:hypothetical protein